MHLHVDGAAGLSGDMALGALLDLGVPERELVGGLERLGVSGWRLRVQRKTFRGLVATRATVEVDPSAEDGRRPHRGLRQIEDLIEGSGLPARVRERSLAVFRRLCEAEGRVHGVPAAEAHLHEVGAVDALVDVCGACLGLEWLGVDTISCSPPDLGGGTVTCAHGVLPVPAPAVLHLLAGRPVTTSGLEVELTTPTGAALLAALAERWGTLPSMVPERTGFGAGQRELPDRANVVRFTLGHLDPAGGPDAADAVVVEADMDDADPQVLASFAERALELGALDVCQVPVLMKKGRGGTRLSILCTADERPALVDALFAETTTIGCRWMPVRRAACTRETVTVETAHGPVSVKLARWQGRIVNWKPEHDDCVDAARRHGVPVKVVVSAALAALGLPDSTSRKP